MPFCPKCKYEYEKEIKTCPDCGSELVDELVIENHFNNPVYYDNNLEYLEKLKAFLIENNVKNVSINHEEDRDTYSLCTDTSSKYKATTLLNILFKEELEQEAENDSEANDDNNNSELESNFDDNEAKASSKGGKKYKSVAEKYNDYLGTGILNTAIGIICDIGLFMDILPVEFKGISNIFALGGMGIVFNLFLISGIWYLIKARKVHPEIAKEKQLTEDILNYIKDNFNKEYFDEKLNNADENNIYFERIKLINTAITNKFDNLDENYLDNLIETIYEDLFE